MMKKNKIILALYNHKLVNCIREIGEIVCH